MALYQLHINYRPYQCHCEMCIYLVSITSRPHLHFCGLVLTIQIPLGSALVDTFWHRSHWQVLQKSILYTYIWANYNNSLTWNKSILGWFLLLTMIPDIYIYTHTSHIYIYIRHIYIYTVKMKVRMPPRIPNIPPPQLECGPRTAKNPSVRMPPHPGFKFFCFWRTLCTNPSLRMPPHYEYHQMLECS